MDDNHLSSIVGDVKLLLNIKHPSFEDCYLFGYECASKNLKESDNPFESTTRESEFWLEGWWDGIYGETPLFTHDLTDGLTDDAVHDLSEPTITPTYRSP